MVVDSALRSAVETEFGAVGRVVPVGITRNTCIISADRATLVAKRMDYVRAPGQYADLFDKMIASASVPCPRLARTVELADCWYALFFYVNGSAPSPDDAHWSSIWQAAFQLLERLRDLTQIVPEWDLESIWLERLLRFDFLYPPARDLLHNLLGAAPAGPRAMTHGDFSTQNFLWASNGLTLVDWEEIGSAHIGFDAGWTLALNRIGSGPRCAQEQLFAELAGLGFPEANLRWFEGLGLLRLLYRASTLPVDAAVRAILMDKIRGVITAFL
jgi:hypothetical protein